MKICILGCGPAGLMAAHAARLQGHTPKIFSHKEPSPIGGAQYLHEPIEGLMWTEELTITYNKIGDARGYAEKVYGDPDHPTSWDKFPEGPVPALSLRSAYTELCSIYWDYVEQHIITPGEIDRLCGDHDLVFCTLPAHKLCMNEEHMFASQSVILQPLEAVENVLWVQENSILYNGVISPTAGDWYRISNLDGEGWAEYALHGQVPEPVIGQVEGFKPIKTDCDCHQRDDNFIRIGRFGQFKKGVLVNDAFNETLDELGK